MRRERLFVLRLWSDGDDADTWRASLENLRTKEIRNFKGIVDLQDFFGTPALLESQAVDKP